jgi:hypothetical protein
LSGSTDDTPPDGRSCRRARPRSRLAQALNLHPTGAEGRWRRGAQ